MKRQLVVVASVVQLLHQLDHCLSRLDRKAELTALILEVVADGALLFQHVQVDLLGVLGGELSRRPAAQLENIRLVAVGHSLAHPVLPPSLHDLVGWQSSWCLLLATSGLLDGRGGAALGSRQFGVEEVAGWRRLARSQLRRAVRISLGHLAQAIEAAAVDFLEDLHGLARIRRCHFLWFGWQLTRIILTLNGRCDESFAASDGVYSLGDDVQLAALAGPLDVTVELGQAGLAHRLCDHRVATTLASQHTYLLACFLQHGSQFIVTRGLGCSVRGGVGVEDLIAVED